MNVRSQSDYSDFLVDSHNLMMMTDKATGSVLVQPVQGYNKSE